MKEKEKRSENIVIKVTHEEKKIIKLKAAIYGMSISEYLRALALKSPKFLKVKDPSEEGRRRGSLKYTLVEWTGPSGSGKTVASR
jgi:hypothetical protein